MAKELKTWALFGPPLGRTWEPTDGRARSGSPTSARSSPTTGRSSDRPPRRPTKDRARPAVDLATDRARERRRPTRDGREPPPAWHGTILPGVRRRHLARRRLRRLRADRRPREGRSRRKRRTASSTAADQDRLDRRPVRPDLALPDRRRPPRGQGHRRCRETRADLRSRRVVRDRRRQGRAPPGRAPQADGRRAVRCDFMDDFGRAHAGQPGRPRPSSSRRPRRPTASRSARSRTPGSNGDALASSATTPGPATPSGRFWAVDSFERQPEKTLIVYGTLAEADAQREAADSAPAQARQPLGQRHASRSRPTATSPTTS